MQITGTITVVRPAQDRWFLNEIGVGAQARAVALGHEVVVHRIPVGPHAERSAADRIEAAFAAEDSLGAIAAGFPYRRGVDDKDRFLAWQRPLVMVGGSVLGFPVVAFDDIGVGRIATTHLAGLGHDRIVHLTGTLDPDRAFVFHRARARGYRMAMEGAGLTPRVVEADLGGPYLEEEISDLLGGRDRPTAVFAVDDEIAFTVMEVAARIGLQVGRDLSIVGVNDHPDADRRGLTTIRHRPSDAGAAAVEMILDGLQPGAGSTKSRLTPSTFVQRASTSGRSLAVA